MPISPSYVPLDTSLWTHCEVTIRLEHEATFAALLNTVTPNSQCHYVPVGEVLLSGLSEDQISQLIEGREDLIYHDDYNSVYVLEDLWEDAEEVVARIAPNAIIQRLIDAGLGFDDPRAVDKLAVELAASPLLNYTEIEF